MLGPARRGLQLADVLITVSRRVRCQKNTAPTRCVQVQLSATYKSGNLYLYAYAACGGQRYACYGLRHAANPQVRPRRLLCVSALPSKANFGYCCPMRAACVTRRGKAVCVSYCVRALTYALGGKRGVEKAVGWGEPTGPRRLYDTLIRVRHRQPGPSLLIRGAFYPKFGIMAPYVSLILL